MNNPISLEQSGVPLSDMIEALRAELQRSMERGKDQPVAFNVEKAELELKVAVSQKAKGGVGVAFWVVKAEAGAEVQRDFSHTFKLTLKPVSGQSGQPINIAALAPAAEAPGDH